MKKPAARETLLLLPSSLTILRIKGRRGSNAPLGGFYRVSRTPRHSTGAPNYVYLIEICPAPPTPCFPFARGTGTFYRDPHIVAGVFVYAVYVC